MACPPLITNFHFCLKSSNQMIFNNIGFPTKGGGDMPNDGTYKKKMKKCIFAFLFTKIETVDIGHWKFYK